MEIYRRSPYYYETDQMRIVHHSNYIRWFEEARIHYLDAIGMSFAAQEASGIVCPVLSVEAAYKQMVHFGDTVEILTRLTMYNGLRYGFSYEVRNAGTGTVCCTGSSTHCFLNPEGKPMRVRRDYPEMHSVLTRQLAEDTTMPHKD
jgi:acyl-CoA thioester hydrolase